MIKALLDRQSQAIFRALLVRELRARFVGSAGGWWWSLLHPLLQLAIYAVVFGTIFRVRFPELGRHDFLTFVAVALWPWLIFQDGILRGAQAIQANAGLIKKVAFPHSALVYASVAATFAIHAIGFVLVLIALSIFDVGIDPLGAVLALPILGLLLLATVSVALVCAAAQVFLRDIEQILGPLMMVGLYASPVLYSVTSVPPNLQFIVAANPLTHFIEPLRSLLLSGSATIVWSDILVWLLVPLAFLAAKAGFRRLSPHFEDFI